MKEADWQGWKLIWGLRVQTRIRYFLWLLAHDRLLTNKGPWRRGLAPNPCCARCLADHEDGIHMVRDCEASREVWGQLRETWSMHEFYSAPLQEWLLTSLRFGNRTRGGAWPVKMAVTAWLLWKWRNDEIFGKGIMPIQERMEAIERCVEEHRTAWGHPPNNQL